MPWFEKAPMTKESTGSSGCGQAIVTLIFAVGFLWWLRPEPNLDASLSITSDELTRTVTMTVTVSNRHKNPVTLDSIDIDASFLAGLEVEAVDPKPRGRSDLPVLNQGSWKFGVPVSPGKTLPIIFTFKPVRLGHFSGKVEVCNPNQDSITLQAKVFIAKLRIMRPVNSAAQQRESVGAGEGNFNPNVPLPDLETRKRLAAEWQARMNPPAPPAKPPDIQLPADAHSGPPVSGTQPPSPPNAPINAPRARSAPDDFVGVGTTEARLLELKGAPQSKATMGNKAIFRWPDMQVTLVDGKVDQIQSRDRVEVLPDR